MKSKWGPLCVVLSGMETSKGWVAGGVVSAFSMLMILAVPSAEATPINDLSMTWTPSIFSAPCSPGTECADYGTPGGGTLVTCCIPIVGMGTTEPDLCVSGAGGDTQGYGNDDGPELEGRPEL